MRSSFKSLFPPIHQPLPLNKQESKKLLNALTSSFRAHLDHEHDPSAAVTTTAAAAEEPGPAITYLPSNPVSVPSRPKPKTNPGRPTDRHLRAILNNPLFKHNDGSCTTAPPSRSAMEPKEVFERAVAKGMMTIPRAHGFLMRVAQDIRQSPAITISDGMRESGAGLQVVRWLRASGQERELGFLGDQKFTLELVRFMVAEGLEELAWSWLQRLLANGVATAGPDRSAWLLKALVDANAAAVTPLDSAYSTVLRADGLAQKHSSKQLLLNPAWEYLARVTIRQSWHRSVPAVDLFDPFVAVGRRDPNNHVITNAHLDLFHPTQPSPTRALRYIDQDLVSPAAFWEQNAKEGISKPVKFLKYLGIDTAKHLTKAGEVDRAEWVLERLNTYLAAIGVSQISLDSIAKEVRDQSWSTGLWYELGGQFTRPARS